MKIRQTTFQAIGTEWNIRVAGVVYDAVWTQLLETIHEQIEQFDTRYSRFRSDSLVTKISQRPGEYALPSDGYKMLHFYDTLYKATKGKVTPLIGQAVADAGYDAAYSFQASTLTEPPHWRQALSYDKHNLRVKQSVLLDFGAAGKGYLVDIISDCIEAAGVTDYLVNAGGDIRYRSEHQEPLDVGLENPMDTSEAVGIVRVVNQSLCASAGSKRKWGEFHHIIDPSTLKSPTRVLATWVLADETMIADGLATALFFVDAESLGRQFDFSYGLLYDDMSFVCADDFPVTVFQAGAV